MANYNITQVDSLEHGTSSIDKFDRVRKLWH